MWLRSARFPLLIAWLIVLGTVAYLWTHPRLIAPFAARLISRNLLREVDGKLRFQDFRWRYLDGFDLYRVSISLRGEGGALTLISVDTLSVNYRLGEVFSTRPRLRWVAAKGGEVYVLGGQETRQKKKPSIHLPHFQMDQVEILDFSVEVSGSDGRLQERIPELNWRGIIRSDTVLMVECRDAEVWWETRDSRISSLYGVVTAGENGLGVQNLHFHLNESEAVVSGRLDWNGNLDLQAQGQRLDVVEIENLIDVALDFAAVGDLDATIKIRGDSLYFDGLFNGELEGYQLQNVHGRAVIMPETIHWAELSGRINTAQFSGSGEFDLSRPAGIAFTLTGDVAHVDLSRKLVPEEELPASDGHGHVTIFHSDDPLLTHVTGYLLDGFIADIPFDSSFVDIRVDSSGVIFNGVDLQYQGQMARLTGHADTSRYFTGWVDLDVPDLGRLPPEWQLPRLSGAVTGSGDLRGQDSLLTFTGQVSLHEAAINPLRVGSAQADVIVADVLGDQQISLRVQGEGLTVGDVPLGSFRVGGTVSAAAARVDSFRSVRGDTVVVFRGQADFVDSTVVLHIGELAVDLEHNHWRMPEPTLLRVGPDGVTLPKFRFASEYGELTLRDLDSRGTTMSGSLLLYRFDLGLVNPFLPDSMRVNGGVTAEVHLSGTSRQPLVQVTADIVDSRFDLASIDSLHVELEFGQGRLAIDRLWLASNYGRVRLAGTITHPGVSLARFWPEAALDLTLGVEDGDWAFLDQFALPALDRLAGRYDTTLRITGTSDDPLITGDVASEPFHIHWLHLENMHGRVRLERDQMVLSDLIGRQGNFSATGRIELPLTFDLLSVPDSPLDGPFLMRFTIPENSDLTPLADATNAFTQCSGRGSGDVTIAGPLDHPYWYGTVKVRDAGFVLKRMSEIYQDVEVDGRFAQDVLTLHNIRGREGAKGTFHGSGTVTFSGLELETFAIDLVTDRFLVASIPDLRVLVRSEDVRLSGVKVGPDSVIVPRFTGNLEVIKARYTGDFSENTAGLGDPLAATVAPDWLADVAVVAPPRTVRIFNRAMELYMSGDVNLVRDVPGLYLRGSMIINAGRFPVFNNDFKVVRGRLDFSREVGLIPRVDMEAETRVRVQSATDPSSRLELISVYVTGSLAEPEVSFSSESGYAREGIERLLLGLSPYADQPQAYSGLRGASIAAGFNLLEREIAMGLNVIDTFDIEQVDRQQDGGTTVSPLIGVGKYLGQDLYIKYAQGLSQADRDLLIEYQITHHLLLQSSMRRRIDELQGDTTYNLDLKYRFEY